MNDTKTTKLNILHDLNWNLRMLKDDLATLVKGEMSPNHQRAFADFLNKHDLIKPMARALDHDMEHEPHWIKIGATHDPVRIEVGHVGEDCSICDDCLMNRLDQIIADHIDSKVSQDLALTAMIARELMMSRFAREDAQVNS